MQTHKYTNAKTQTHKYTNANTQIHKYGMTPKGLGCLQFFVLGPSCADQPPECGRRHVRLSGNTSHDVDDDDDFKLSHCTPSSPSSSPTPSSSYPVFTVSTKTGRDIKGLMALNNAVQ